MTCGASIGHEWGSVDSIGLYYETLRPLNCVDLTVLHKRRMWDNRQARKSSQIRHCISCCTWGQAHSHLYTCQWDPHLKQKCFMKCKWAAVHCVSRSYVASGRLLQNGLIYIGCVAVVLIALTMLTLANLFSFRQGIHLATAVCPEFLAVVHGGGIILIAFMSKIAF